MPVDLDHIKPFMGFCATLIYTYSTFNPIKKKSNSSTLEFLLFRSPERHFTSDLCIPQAFCAWKETRVWRGLWAQRNVLSLCKDGLWKKQLKAGDQPVLERELNGKWSVWCWLQLGVWESFRYQGAGDDPEAKRKVGELHLQRRKTRPLEQKRKVEGRWKQIKPEKVMEKGLEFPGGQKEMGDLLVE